MHTTNSITISAPYQKIFSLAAHVERWDELLPHYRYVKLLKQSGNRKLVRMSAWRDIVPVTWTAIETVEPGSEEEPGRITFHHVRGLVKGMDVEWAFRRAVEGEGWHVTIMHELSHPPFPVRILGRSLINLLVGEGFIGYIANKTLQTIKQLAEEEQ